MASVAAQAKETVSYLSPSGQFKLVLIQETQWPRRIFRASIRRSDTVGGPSNWLPAAPDGTYPDFKYQFFNQKGQEWFWYQIQRTRHHFVNMETGQIYTGPVLNQFHWSMLHFNPGGTLVAVGGYLGEEQYEFRFYDLRKISTGWPEIKIQECPYHEALYFYDNNHLEWLDETRAEIEQAQSWSLIFDQPHDTLTASQLEAEKQRDEKLEREADELAEKLGEEPNYEMLYPEKVMYRAILRYETFTGLPLGDQMTPTGQMVYEMLEPSPIYLAQIEANKIDQAKRRAFDQNFPNNTRYRTLKAAFPNSSVYFFDYKGVWRDVDSPIEAIHFGLTVLIGNDLYSIHSYPHETTVALGTYQSWNMTEPVQKFETLSAALAYLETQRIRSISLQLTTSPWHV